jgi:hypothetical protein
LQRLGLLRKIALLLQADLQSADLLFQLLVFFLNLLQRKVVLPRAPDPRRHRVGAPLHFGKHPEHRLLQHRHTAPGGDLRRDQDDVRDDHREEEVAGAAADIDDGHCLKRGTLHGQAPQTLGDTDMKDGLL